jgi:hypothetical protein
LCGNWEAYKDEKCIKIFDESKLFTLEDAEKSCSEADNGSSILTVYSIEEQDFVSEFLFKTHKIVDNIWLGLKNNNNNFKWTDGTELKFTNWANGNPSKKTDFNCVQMSQESTPIGKWQDVPCNKKNLAVCQKTPTVSIPILQKALLETKNQLKETNFKLNELLKILLNDKWINYKLFTDTDGKHKVFFIPLGEESDNLKQSWDNAVKMCSQFNASLIELSTWQKQLIFESFWFHLGFETNRLNNVWLNAKRDSSGKYKWLASGKEFTPTNWGKDYPKTDSGYDYINIFLNSSANATIIQWFNDGITNKYGVICELEIKF